MTSTVTFIRQPLGHQTAIIDGKTVAELRHQPVSSVVRVYVRDEETCMWAGSMPAAQELVRQRIADEAR